MNEVHNIHIVWKKFQLGNKEAFAIIYNMYLDILYRYGTKLCNDEEIVKDAIQEVFIDLYIKRERIKTDPENLKYYLFLSLKRNLIKKLKTIRKWNNRINLLKELSFEPVYNMEQKMIDNEEEKKKNQFIKVALNQLPSKQKEVLYLRYNELLEYDQIAKVLDISVESARKQVYRAIKSIRETIGTKTLVLWLLFANN